MAGFLSVAAKEFVPQTKLEDTSNPKQDFVPQTKLEGTSTPKQDFVPHAKLEEFVPRIRQETQPEVKQEFATKVKHEFVPKIKQEFQPRTKQEFATKVKQEFPTKDKQEFVPPRVKQEFVPKIKQEFRPKIKQEFVPKIKQGVHSQISHHRKQVQNQASKQPLHSTLSVDVADFVPLSTILTGEQQQKAAIGETASKSSKGKRKNLLSFTNSSSENQENVKVKLSSQSEENQKVIKQEEKDARYFNDKAPAWSKPMSWSSIVKQVPLPPKIQIQPKYQHPSQLKQQPSESESERNAVQKSDVTSVYSRTFSSFSHQINKLNWRETPKQDQRKEKLDWFTQTDEIQNKWSLGKDLSQKPITEVKEKPNPNIVVKKKLTRTLGIAPSPARTNIYKTAFYYGASVTADKLKNDDNSFQNVQKLETPFKESTESNYRISKPKTKWQHTTEGKQVKNKLSFEAFLKSTTIQNTAAAVSTLPAMSYSAMLKKTRIEIPKPVVINTPINEISADEKRNVKKKEKSIKRKLKVKQKKAEAKLLQEGITDSKADVKMSQQKMTLDISGLFDKLMLEPKESPNRTIKKKVAVSTGVISVSSGLAKKNTPSGKRVARNKSGNIQTILDGTVLIRKRGKERENPKRKRPTLMKKIINAERERRKKLREKEENSKNVIKKLDFEENETSVDKLSELIGVVTVNDKTNTVVVMDEKPSIDEINPSTIKDEKVVEDNDVQEIVYKGLTHLPEEVWKKLHSRKFREYCNHVLTKDINNHTNTLLTTLQRYQDRVYHEAPMKYKQKRRFVLGLREVLKNLKVKKIKAVILAPNMERIASQGGIDDYLSNILSYCDEYELPKVYAMNRHTLGRAVRKKAPVSVIGIFNYDGAQDTFKDLMSLVEEAKIEYTNKVNKILEELTNEISETKNEIIESTKTLSGTNEHPCIKTGYIKNTFVPNTGTYNYAHNHTTQMIGPPQTLMTNYNVHHTNTNSNFTVANSNFTVANGSMEQTVMYMPNDAELIKQQILASIQMEQYHVAPHEQYYYQHNQPYL